MFLISELTGVSTALLYPLSHYVLREILPDLSSLLLKFE